MSYVANGLRIDFDFDFDLIYCFCSLESLRKNISGKQKYENYM